MSMCPYGLLAKVIKKVSPRFDYNDFFSFTEECVDVRQRQCYLEWDSDSNKCSNAAGAAQTRRVCCCSVGRAWGAPCERCPAPSEPEYAALCGARPGLYRNPVTNETKPINECDIMPQLCKPGTCHDTPTGFTCGCDHGYVLASPLFKLNLFEARLPTRTVVAMSLLGYKNLR